MPDHGTTALGVWYRTLCLLVMLGTAGAASAQVAPTANNDAIALARNR